MAHSHFKGKAVVDHLKEARAKGALATFEMHGVEMPGHLSAAADAIKESVVLFSLLSLAFPNLSAPFLWLFACGWLVWKTGRSAMLGWARLERLHRLIEEERWEIEHHREQEREELTAMYRAKGLSGKLLEETVDVLMADDNRLLRIMLEEELGLTLEIHEHPLKQATGALIGTVIGSGGFLVALFTLPQYFPLLVGAGLVAAAAFCAAKIEKNRCLEAVTWSVSLFGFACGAVYFLCQAI